MAVVGLTANWHAKSIQTTLVEDNINTTRMVEISANIERSLYQSLVYLSAIKETEELELGSLTMDAPNLEMLTKGFYNEVGVIYQNLHSLEEYLQNRLDSIQQAQMPELELFEDRFTFYVELSEDWLNYRDEYSEASSQVYNTSISPYFRNNIIPVISSLREKTISQQIHKNQSLRKQLSRANLAIKIMSAFFVLVAMAVGYYLYKNITTPLSWLIKSAERLGTGNLDERIELDRKDEIGKLAESFNTMASKLKKRTMARDYLDNIIEAIQETLIVTDEHDIIVGCNNAASHLLGYSKEELLGLNITQLFVDEALPLKAEVESNQQEVFEFALLTKHGESIPVLFSEGVLNNTKGELVGKVFVATDITQRKEASERIKQSLREKDVLIAEIHHRVKNNLAVISGLLQLQSYSSTNSLVIKALKESQARIQSISLVHEKLYQSDSLAYIKYDQYVDDFLNEIANMDFGLHTPLTLKAEVDQIQLDVNVAVPCSLLLNEILLNSYQSAYNKKTTGEVYITIKEIDETVHLTVETKGISIVDRDEKLSQSLIETLISQLHGTYRFKSILQGKGSGIEIVFPKSEEE